MADENRIRLLIAEEHPVLRQALELFFSLQDTIELIGQAGDTNEAIPLVEKLQPDIILIDSNLQPMNLLMFIARLHDECPTSRIVTLSSNLDLSSQKALLEAGASKTIDKDVLASELLTIIHQVYHKD